MGGALIGPWEQVLFSFHGLSAVLLRAMMNGRRFHVDTFWLYVYTFYVYMHAYKFPILQIYMRAYSHKTYKRIDVWSYSNVHAYMLKQITFYVDFDAYRHPAKKKKKQNLRTLSHRIQKNKKCLYVYVYTTICL